MKFIILSLVVVSFLYSDEMKIMQSAVKEISLLRVNYEKCVSQLSDAKIGGHEDLSEYKSLLEKEKEKNTLLEAKIKMLSATAVVKKESKKESKKKEKEIRSDANTGANAFRIRNDNVVIYDAIEGKELEKWEKSTSFTSNVKAKNWIKITGHFVDHKWRKSTKDMWVKEAEAVQR